MNHNEIHNYFAKKIGEYSKIASRVDELRRKLGQVRSMEDDSMIQLNMGISVFSVSKASATSILIEAINVEEQYARLMHDRFMDAIAIINGEDV